MRRPPSAAARSEHRPLLGLVAAAPVGVDLGDELVGEVADRAGDEEHDGEALGDRRRRAGSAWLAMFSARVAAREDEPARDRAGDPEADRAFDRGQHEDGPVGRLRAACVRAGPTTTSSTTSVSARSLDDAEQDAGAGVLALGDVRRRG